MDVCPYVGFHVTYNTDMLWYFGGGCSKSRQDLKFHSITVHLTVAKQTGLDSRHLNKWYEVFYMTMS
jgi:hypothetical protein